MLTITVTGFWGAAFLGAGLAVGSLAVGLAVAIIAAILGVTR